MAEEKMRPLEMTYLMRGSLLTLSSSASAHVSGPLSGSWVMSSAVTTPAEFGLWSEGRAAWAASPIQPSDSLLRFGQRALIWSRKVARLLAIRGIELAPMVGNRQ